MHWCVLWDLTGGKGKGHAGQELSSVARKVARDWSRKYFMFCLSWSVVDGNYFANISWASVGQLTSPVMDILHELNARSCHHVLYLILSFLNSCDITSCQHVSTDWRRIVRSSFWSSSSIKRLLSKNKTDPKNECSYMEKVSLNTSHLCSSVLECGLYSLDQEYSNIHFLWILYETTKSLMLEEWCLFQSFQKWKEAAEVFLQEKNTQDISAVGYRNDILALGFNSGSVHVYQDDGETGVMSLVSMIEVQSKTITMILVTDSMIVCCSQDCSIVVISLGLDGSLIISNLLQVWLHIWSMRGISGL